MLRYNQTIYRLFPDLQGTITFLDPLEFFESANLQYYSVLYDLFSCAGFYSSNSSYQCPDSICFTENRQVGQNSNKSLQFGLIVGGAVIGGITFVLIIIGIFALARKYYQPKVTPQLLSRWK